MDELYYDPDTKQYYREDEVNWDDYIDTGVYTDQVDQTTWNGYVTEQQRDPQYEQATRREEDLFYDPYETKPWYDEYIMDPLMGFGINMASGVNRQVAGAAEMIGDFSQNPYAQTAPLSGGLMQLMDITGASEALSRFGRQQKFYSDVVESKLNNMLDYDWKDPRYWATKIGGVLPQAAAAYVAPNPATFWSTLFAGNVGSRYGDLRGQGVQPGAAGAGAVVSGAVNTALDKLTDGVGFDPGASLMKKIGWNMLANPWEEAGGEAFDVVIDRTLTGEWDPNAGDRIGQAAILGEFSGPLIASAAHFGRRRQMGAGEIADPNRTIDPETDPQVVRAAQAQAEAARLQKEAGEIASDDAGEILRLMTGEDPEFGTIPEVPKAVQEEFGFTKKVDEIPDIPKEQIPDEIDLVEEVSQKTMPDVAKVEVKEAKAEVKKAVDKINQKPVQEYKGAKVPEKPQDDLATYVENLPVRRMELKNIGFLPEVMQFKDISTDAKRGTNERDYVNTPWSDAKSGNILIWEPINPKKITTTRLDPDDMTGTKMLTRTYSLKKGQKYVVANGHNRLAGAKDQNINDGNVQIIREADGWTPELAYQLAAEINIGEGNGTLLEKSTYLRWKAAIHGKDAGKIRAKLLGEKAKSASTLAFDASDNVWHAFVHDKIAGDQATAIAKAAPDAPDIQQQLLTETIQQDLTPKAIEALSHSVRTFKRMQAQNEQLNLLENDQAQRLMDQWRDRSLEGQRLLTEDIRAMDNAAKNPEAARRASGGLIDPKDPAAVRKIVKELKEERRRWKHWSRHEDVRAQITGEAPSKILNRPGSKRTIQNEAGVNYIIPEFLEAVDDTINRLVTPDRYDRALEIVKGNRTKSEDFYDPNIKLGGIAVGKKKVPGMDRTINEIVGAYRKTWAWWKTVASKFPEFRPTWNAANAEEKFLHKTANKNFQALDPLFALDYTERWPVQIALIASRLNAEDNIRPVENDAYFDRIGLNQRQRTAYRAARSAFSSMVMDLKRPGMMILQRNLKVKEAEFAKDTSNLYEGTRQVVKDVEQRNFTDQDLVPLGLNAQQRRMALDYQRTMGEPDEYIKAQMFQNRRLAYWRAGKRKIDGFINNNINARYIPIGRFGDEYLSVTNLENGVTEWFSLHGKSGKELHKLKAELRQQYPATQFKMETQKMTAPDNDILGMLPLNLASQLGDIDPESAAMFKAAMPLGFPKHFIKPKFTAGFSADFDRAISEYVLGHAHYKAKHEFAQQWDDALTQIDEKTMPRLYSQAIKYRTDIHSTKNEYAALRKFATLYYLAGNVKSGVVNLTQPIVTTYAELASRLRNPEAYLQDFNTQNPRKMNLLKAEVQANAIFAKSYAKAFQWFTAKNTMDPELRRAIQVALDDGRINEEGYRQLAGMTRGQDRGDLHVGRRPLADILMFTFTGPEYLNRIHALICGYEVATKIGLSGDERIKYAENMIDDTQFIYGNVNRPSVMRGKTAPLFIFKTWAGSMLRFWRSHANAREFDVIGKSLIGFGLLGGVTAIPGWKLIEKALETAGFNVKEEERKLLAEQGYTKKTQDAILYGLPTLYDVSISGPLSLAELPATDQGAEAALFNFFTGAMGNMLIGRPKKALYHWEKGQKYRAVESLLPEMQRSLSIMGRWSGLSQGMGLTKELPGVRSPSGIEQIKNPTIQDITVRGLGFQPKDLILNYEKENAKKIVLDKRLNNGNIHEKLGRAYAFGDGEEIGRLLFNAYQQGINIDASRVVDVWHKWYYGKDLMQRNVPKDVRPIHDYLDWTYDRD